MKKNLLLVTCLFLFFSVNSQIIDTVSISAGYTDQVWYSLENGEQRRSSQTNWDIAFDIKPMGTSIHINSANGVMLWAYPNADTSGWSTIDTSGISSWQPKYNSDTTWSIGAFDKGMTGHPFDFGWGKYNLTTHIVSGDSLFVIKLTNGDFKKLWIERLVNETYEFKYANLDGSNTVDVSLAKAAYPGKMFAYYSLQNDSIIDREPLKANWDLTFTKYTEFIPIPYGVTGILTNSNVEVAQVNNVDVASYNNYGTASFTTRFNEIGYDWKSFSMGNGYVIEDSLLFFVKTDSNKIWKIVPTGFGGSADGNFMFSKEEIISVGLQENKHESLNLKIYPNPATNGNVHILYDIKHFVADATLSLYDISGKRIFGSELNKSIGFHDFRMNVEGLKAGMYFISIYSKGKSIQRKLIIQ